MSIIEFSSFFLPQISNRWGSQRKEQGAKLNLTATQRTDSGQYTCIATNGVGQPDSAQITLRVQCKYLLLFIVQIFKKHLLPIKHLNGKI